MTMQDKFLLSLNANEDNGKADTLGMAARMVIASKAEQIRISMVPRTDMKGGFMFNFSWCGG